MPADGDQLMFRHELDAERAILNREKLSLAAEVICKPPDRLVQPEPISSDDWLGPKDREIDQVEEPRRRRWWLALAVPALAAGAAASAYAIDPAQFQPWLTQLQKVLG
jgi:hypothetical protein